MKKFILLVLSVFIFAACATNNNSNTDTNNSSQDNEETLVLTSIEVAKHNSASDCWTIIEGNVYNITSYINLHPGGRDEIMQACGKDATQLFSTQGGEGQHSPSAENMLKSFLLGTLQQ